MRVFRKVVLPVVWALIFSAIAVSLGVIAFGSDDPPNKGSGLKPTGEIPVSNTGVARGTVENTLRVTGTITVDPPASAKATHDGVINHFFVPAGAKVRAGDALLQIKSEEGDAGPGEDGEDPPKPTTRYHNVLATKSGTVASFAKEIGDTVTKGDAVASIRQSSYRATGSILPVDQYRLLDLPKSATVTITGGPAPFKCRDLAIGDTIASEDNTGKGNGDPSLEEFPQEMGDEGGSGAEGGASISCRVPSDVKVFDGLEMNMSIDAGAVEGVLVVPVTAVRGLIDSGSVWVIGDEGEPVERKVGLGLSDGRVVEVKKGLKEGENVLEFVPGASPEEGGEEEFGYGVG